MANLFSDPSFAAGSPPWETEGLVVFGAAFGRPHGASLTGRRVPPIGGSDVPAAVKQSVTVSADQLYELEFWGYASPGGSGIDLLFGGATVSGFSSDAAPETWTRLTATWIPPSDASDLFAFRVAPFGTWWLDDVSLVLSPEVSRMKRGLRLAYLDVIKALQGISTGAGYHHDVKDVKPRKVHPASGGLTPLPYICAPIEADAVAVEQNDAWSIVSLPINVYVYPVLNECEVAEASAAADILDWYDDIARCVMPINAGEVSTLGSRYIENVTIGSARMYSDPAPDDPAHLMFPVTVAVKVSRDSLGA